MTYNNNFSSFTFFKKLIVVITASTLKLSVTTPSAIGTFKSNLKRTFTPFNFPVFPPL